MSKVPVMQRVSIKEAMALFADDLPYDKWSKPQHLDDGRTVEARMVSDVESDLKDDGDWFGKLEWDEGTGYEKGNRPDGFDGGAVVVYADRNRLWLQPPTDLTPEGRESLIKRVKEYYLRYWWFAVIQLRVTGVPCECCKESKVAVQSLGGVESDMGSDDLTDVLTGLLADSEV